MNSHLFVRKVRRNLEDYGWRITLTKSLAYVFQAFYAHQVYRIYRIDLTKPRRPAEFDRPGLTFKILDPDDHQAISQIETAHEWLQGGLKESIQGGAICLAALQGEQVAGFNLIGFGTVFMPLVNKKRLFRKGDAWSEQIAVMKQFRNIGLASDLRYRIFEELGRRGFERLYGGALTSNIGSLQLARKVGFREILDIHYYRILGRDFWRHQKVKP
ncbi:MAG: GNAT family N-acetyltransferase [Acidobacteriia bacterium]|nr:GNAT family N-acetyltransferase [Terriglobia bacterium]